MTNRLVKSWFGLRLMLAVGLFPCYCVIGPSSAAQVPTFQANFPKEETQIPIAKWQMAGPFRFQLKDVQVPDADQLPVGLNRDYLKDFGQSESSVDASAFAALKVPKPGADLDKAFRNDLISTAPKTNMLELATIKQPFDFAVAYVATSIESASEQDIVIAAGVDDNMKLWLNHDLLVADLVLQGHSFTKYQRLIGAHLKKGSNFLLIKIGNLTGDWRLIVNLYHLERALQLARENAVNPILMSSVVPAGHPLQLRGDLLPPNQDALLTILDSQHKAVDSADIHIQRSMSKELGTLPGNGVYFCRIAVGKETVEEPFVYGALEPTYQQLSRRVEEFGKGDEAIKIDLEAQLERLKHLSEPDSRKSEFWDQKVAWSLAELEGNLADASKGSETFRHAPGTHLRGYRSSVDGQVQHYWIHVPEATLKAGKPIPLVIALPYITGQNLPFLESYFLAAFDETERYRILADDFGYAVLQVWGRGNHLGGTAVGTADVLEALEDVKSDYQVDSDRIYLLGYCEGGRLALLLGERYPDRFAAIATVAPVTIWGSRNPIISKWAEYASPITGIKNLKSTPVLIRHDEADGPPPFQESALFSAASEKVGANVSLVRAEGGFHGFYQDPMGEKRAMFTFFLGRERKPTGVEAAAKESDSGFGNGQGPIEDAFGGPVLVVRGTKGTQVGQEGVQNLVTEIGSEWRKAYFVDCMTKMDTEVSTEDIEKFNLVLVGDQTTNAVVAKIAEQLPIRVTEEGVSIDGHSFPGTRLGYEFVARNPLNPRKYVVVIGMNHWSEGKNWKLHPSRDGITDYVVYDLQGFAPRMIGAGYFAPEVWRNELPPSSEAASARHR